MKRNEDPRLLRGLGSFVDDIDPAGVLHAAILRAPHGHARMRSLDVTAARRLSGVQAVYTAGDLGDFNQPAPLVIPHPALTHGRTQRPLAVDAVSASDLTDVGVYPDFITYMQPVKATVLAQDKVRYVGAPIAAVVGEDRYAAEDGVELVEVDYGELPPVTTREAALADDAPKLFDHWPDNRIVNSPLTLEDVEEVFRTHRVVRGSYATHRHSGVPMETRGCAAEYRHGRLTLWTATQSPHIVRTTLSYVLPIAERDIRVVAPDVGGGFGTKTHIYPEEVLVCWLAMRLGRPVRWIEDRTEHLVATRCSVRSSIQRTGRPRRIASQQTSTSSG